MNTPNMPWLDLRLTEEAMKHLWDNIDTPGLEQKDARAGLAGNISKSIYIQDKENWFYENILKGMSEELYFKDWNNYFETVVAESKPPPSFKLWHLWVNYQKQHEFNPPHDHGGLFSFVVFMKIPTYWKEQHALPICVNSNSPGASDFAFLLGVGGSGQVKNIHISLNPEDEGRILFFPAWLKHQVFPFYECEEDRVTISGNIIGQQQENEETSQSLLDKSIEVEIRRLTSMREEIKHAKIKNSEKK